jgi:hypothetical protein
LRSKWRAKASAIVGLISVVVPGYLGLPATASVQTSPKAPALFDVRPSLSVPPEITGDVRANSRLTVSRGSWSDSPTSYAYSWHSCTQSSSLSTSKPTTCSAISGANASTYLIPNSQIGRFLVVSVRAANRSGSTTSWTASTSAVAASPSNSSPPTVSGNRTTGSTLSVSAGTWLASPEASTSYQWFRCNVSLR